MRLYIIPTFHRVFIVKILSLLVIFHVSFIFFAQCLAADELKTLSIENKITSKSFEAGTIELDIYTNDHGMRFVAVSPGHYVMGSPSNELGRISLYEKQHEITIEKQFYIQTTEVTQKQWEEVMGNNPSFFLDCGEDCPVENVSWHNVQKFIRELNRNDTVNRYRLPTEAEWEFACRGGSTTAFSNGDLKEIHCYYHRNLKKIAWYSCNSDNTTHPVGHKMPNRMGLYDMHGNVIEWCQDNFAVNYPDSFDQNVLNLNSTKDKVVRGGSWRDSSILCRSASRLNLSPSSKTPTVGFRLVGESKYYKIKMPPSLETEKKEPKKSQLKIATVPPKSQSTSQTEFREPSIFTVQVESSKSLDYAERQVARFKKQGYDVFHFKVKIPNMGTWYRICFGKFKSKSNADLFRKKLKRENIHGIILEM